MGDSWSETTTTGAPSARYNHSAVWAGTKMIVWGGNDDTVTNTGGQYDPVGDSWTATATGAPSGRDLHAAFWTGSRMIVWGGQSSGPALNTGGQDLLLSLYVRN